jgi:hypothetical protein
MRTQRLEACSVGFDDFVQLTGGPPVATGLRVPPLVGPTYRFLAATVDLTVGDTVVGLRQFASIASYPVLAGGVYPEWRPIVTPGWRFIDCQPLTWSVTFEPLVNFVRRRGAFDQESFISRDTSGPALVYETAAFPAFPLLPGYLGLSAYTPPAMRGHKQYELKDVRFPQRQNEFFALRWPVSSPTRVRVYVDAQQSNPATRRKPNFGVSLPAADLFFAPGAIVPEELFLQDFPDAILHAVGAAVLIDRDGEKGAPS